MRSPSGLPRAYEGAQWDLPWWPRWPRSERRRACDLRAPSIGLSRRSAIRSRWRVSACPIATPPGGRLVNHTLGHYGAKDGKPGYASGRCQRQQPHATVTIGSLQGRATPQGGQWAKLRLSSTRRFIARPPAVTFDRIGLVGPSDDLSRHTWHLSIESSLATSLSTRGAK